MKFNGKKPGPGRPKGSPNKIKVELSAAVVGRIKALSDDGLMPIELWLLTMRDESLPLDVRLEASRLAGPYIHKKQPQDVNVAAAFQTPPPVLFVLGPPADMPDDYTPPDAGSKPN